MESDAIFVLFVYVKIGLPLVSLKKRWKKTRAYLTQASP